MVSSPEVLVPPEKRGVGIVFQNLALFPHLTVVQNVSFGIKRYDQELYPEREDDLLELVGLWCFNLILRKTSSLFGK